MYILLAILVFGILIAVHELGHFLVAKACGVRVDEFAIGMGPAIWKKQKGETLYAVRCLPIGGFCAMAGEDEAIDVLDRTHLILRFAAVTAFVRPLKMNIHKILSTPELFYRGGGLSFVIGIDIAGSALHVADRHPGNPANPFNQIHR